MAFTIAIRITAPSSATNILYRLKPVTPLFPKKLISHPPNIAPTIPRIIFRIKLSLVPITNEATQPTIAPKIIHKIMLIYFFN